MLAQKGIQVTVVEKSSDIDRNPRASFYSSPTIYELRRAGLMGDIMKKAFVPDGVAWRFLDGKEICSIYPPNPEGDETMISLPLDELLPIMMEHLARQPSAKVLMNHEVVSIGQDDHHAWVNVTTPEGEKKFEATYIVGCDGANSKIRRELFGGSFPGFTWDKQIVATNVSTPLNRNVVRSSSPLLTRRKGLLSKMEKLQVDNLQLLPRPATLRHDRRDRQRRPPAHHVR